jgi:hypothetical protein
MVNVRQSDELLIMRTSQNYILRIEQKVEKFDDKSIKRLFIEFGP